MTISELCIPRLNLAPTVFIVDDDEAVRRSLELLVREAGWRAESFASAEAFLAYPRVKTPKCLVLDVALPDLSGLDLQEQISVDQPNIPIIFFTSQGDVPMSVRAMRAGAFDFLTKPAADDALLLAIGSAIERSQTILLQEAALQVLSDRYDSLTPREREVMDLVVCGLLNKQIGSELGISEITVKTHRANVMRKMMAASLAALVRFHAKLFG